MDHLDYTLGLFRTHWVRRSWGVHHRIIAWGLIQDLRRMTGRPSKER